MSSANIRFVPSSSATTTFFVSGATAATLDEVDSIVDRKPRKTERAVGKELENAVYLYIRAVRATGRTTINTADISDALGLSIAVVDRVVRALKDKGVKATS